MHYHIILRPVYSLICSLQPLPKPKHKMLLEIIVRERTLLAGTTISNSENEYIFHRWPARSARRTLDKAVKVHACSLWQTVFEYGVWYTKKTHKMCYAYSHNWVPQRRVTGKPLMWVGYYVRGPFDATPLFRRWPNCTRSRKKFSSSSTRPLILIKNRREKVFINVTRVFIYLYIICRYASRGKNGKLW